MLFYGILSKKIKEDLEYYILKIYAFLKTIMPQKKKDRDFNKLIYESEYKNPHCFKNRRNSIPDGKYYQPFAVITSDLILREDIPKLKKGVTKLIKNLYTHKYIGRMESIDETLEKIERMDSLLESWYSSIKVGRFDFTTHKILNCYIDYFDVIIRNINSSYLAVEFQIYLNDKFVNKQFSIINCDYQEKRGYVSQSLTQVPRRKTGLKKRKVVCHYSNENLKSDRLFENITMLEWLFYNEMSKFFPVFFHNRNIVPPIISLYKTNISYLEDGLDSFWLSVGVQNHWGQFLNENEKLFFKTILTSRYSDMSTSSYIYIMNDKNIELKGGYYTKEFRAVSELEDNLQGVTFIFEFLDCMNIYASREIIKYRSKLNVIKLNKNRLNRLLKIRYEYEKAIDCFKRYICDEIWEFAIEQSEDVFKIPSKNIYEFRYRIDWVLTYKERINEQALALEQEFDTKRDVLQHLNSYKNEFHNRILNIVMLILTLLTVIFVVFPDLSEAVRIGLETAWDIVSKTYNYVIDILFTD